jgi:hypothetical protein
MWAARSWNRIWKKQGLPERAYEIIEAKFDAQIDEFHSIQHNIFSHGAGEPDGFEAHNKVKEIREAVAAMFAPGADTSTI